MDLSLFGYAFVGGLLPSLIWLYILLKEDSQCPEPRSIIALAFVAGMVAVPLALPLEEAVQAHVVGIFPVLIGWATVEEVLKYLMAAIFILWRPAVDEPTDYIIYMLTVALGFAAAENMLFLFTSSANGQFFSTGVHLDDLRFLGSTLLHVVASAVIGFSLALSENYSAFVRMLAAATGLILAIALHTAFNALIILGSTSTALFLVWTVVVIFFATFEVLKYFRYHTLPTNTC